MEGGLEGVFGVLGVFGVSGCGMQHLGVFGAPAPSCAPSPMSQIPINAPQILQIPPKIKNPPNPSPCLKMR